MNLLKREKQALASLLEEGADTPEHLVELVVKKLDELRAERVFHFAVWRTAGFYGIIGPFSTYGQAEKALVSARVAEKAWVVPGRSPEGWARHLAEVDTPPEPPKPNAKQEREQAKQFWAKAHAIREGEHPGIIADKGGVTVTNIQDLRQVMGS